MPVFSYAGICFAQRTGGAADAADYPPRETNQANAIPKSQNQQAEQRA